MRCLVAGGSGYFGSLLLAKLRERGWQCRVFDLVDTIDRPADVEFVQGDIRDSQAVAKACEGIGIVHHNIAQVPLAKDRKLFESVNIQGTKNLLEAARAAGVGKIVYTSSSAVYGVPKSNPVTEGSEAVPGEAYGRAKLQGEQLCRDAAAKGLDVTIIRPRTILGHGRLGIFQILFEWIYKGFNVPVLGRGDNLYQFVHADDLADACIRAGERPGPSAYNIGADRFGTMRSTLDAVCRHAATGSRVKSVPMLPAIWAMWFCSLLRLSPLGAYHSLMYGRSMYFDTTKARTELGWQSRYSNEQMFCQSYDWYMQNRAKVLAARNVSLHRAPVKQGILNLVKWAL